MVLSGNAVDAEALASAIEAEVSRVNKPDFRTRLLIRDSIDALRGHWGSERLESWLRSSPTGATIRQMAMADLGPPGFSLLKRRVMETTKKQTVLEFLRELGASCAYPIRIEIGGAIALILGDMLSRRTEDIDIVDEVPAPIRAEHEFLENLATRYGLKLTHFQSHFLPDGWRQRLRGIGQFGELEVFTVDPIDIFVGKLFSARQKDRDDLRAMATKLDKGQIESRYLQSAKSFRADPKLAEYATNNWYILFGEPLPV
jgi:hypothetical protein